MRINENSIWRKQFAESGDGFFQGRDHGTPKEEELRRLRRELQYVTEQHDILREVLDVFSRHNK